MKSMKTKNLTQTKEQEMTTKKELLQEGDVIEIKKGHTVQAMVPNHFLYTNCAGDFSLSEGSVCIDDVTQYLTGNYIVVKTMLDGGSSGRDPYPDGHHVFCVKADDRSVKIDFWQTGCFISMIEDIQPIGKAELTWTITQ
jgi:hypothetical protein